MLIDVSMYILVPLLRLAPQEGNNESDFVHILDQPLPMVVKIGLNIQDKPLHVVRVAIEWTNIELARLLRLGLLLLQHLQSALKFANLRVPGEFIICFCPGIACR